VEIIEDPEVFGLYLGAYVYCRDLTDDEVLYDGSATDSGGTIVLDVEVDDEIVCDWYNITEAPAGGTTGGTTSGGGTVTTLPATGSGLDAADRHLVLILGMAAGVIGLSVALRKRSAI
jgi:hypothetical protein